jgi:hypothetical protein
MSDHYILIGQTPVPVEPFWGGEGGYEQERCSTWLEAEAMHAAMVRAVTRPKAVLAYLLRAWEGYWKEAKEEWLDLWREVAGIEPERSSDPLWQNVMDSMARWKEMRRKQRFT